MHLNCIQYNEWASGRERYRKKETETERGDRLRKMSPDEVNASPVAVATAGSPRAGYESKGAQLLFLPASFTQYYWKKSTYCTLIYCCMRGDYCAFIWCYLSSCSLLSCVQLPSVHTSKWHVAFVACNIPVWVFFVYFNSNLSIALLSVKLVGLLINQWGFLLLSLKSKAKNCQSLQRVPSLSPKVSWDSLQLPHNPEG